MTAKLKIVTTTHRPVIVDKGNLVIPKETAVQIAARLRDGRGPVRQLVWRQSIDGGSQ